MIPSRRIVSPEDLNKWIESPTHAQLVDFITELQNLATGLVNNDPSCVANDSCLQLVTALDNVEKVGENHPIEKDKEVLRFGKPEFRDVYDDIAAHSREWMVGVVGEDAAEEVAVYFTESFGNRTRIDYGSGHELNFLSVLYCMSRLQRITSENLLYLAVVVFPKYMEVMRHIQKVYWLEPAGSHGVWGLDDYHFLPFLLGASQLATHPHMKPKLIHNQELVAMYAPKYMYFECINFVNQIKTIPNHQGQLLLRWHLPMLDDISGAKLWQKIKDGMVKMYLAEVLAKLPIIQHFMFGDIITCPEGINEDHHHGEEDECGHVHSPAHNTWGDCCGIKIPSAYAASESMKKAIPFD